MSGAKAGFCAGCGQVAEFAGRADVRIQSGRLVMLWRGRLCARCVAHADTDPAAVVRPVMAKAPIVERSNARGCSDARD